ncbi:MAG TPA: hypothetical protein VFQ60_04145 [Patescibacteria group bacterium]|nr:hypothetical protein [Patescibacteria group bacterium]
MPFENMTIPEKPVPPNHHRVKRGEKSAENELAAYDKRHRDWMLLMAERVKIQGLGKRGEIGNSLLNLVLTRPDLFVSDPSIQAGDAKTYASLSAFAADLLLNAGSWLKKRFAKTMK